MEGLFNKEDKELWISAIEQLEKINPTVREDIRDYILYSNRRKIKKTDLNESRVSKSSLSRRSSSRENTLGIGKQKKKHVSIKRKTELMIIKIGANAEQRQSLASLADIFHANTK